MSLPPFQPTALPPLMPPSQARDVARALAAHGTLMEELGAIAEARRAERQSQWWLAYALVLDRAPDGGTT